MDDSTLYGRRCARTNILLKAALLALTAILFTACGGGSGGNNGGDSSDSDGVPHSVDQANTQPENGNTAQPEVVEDKTKGIPFDARDMNMGTFDEREIKVR